MTPLQKPPIYKEGIRDTNNIIKKDIVSLPSEKDLIDEVKEAAAITGLEGVKNNKASTKKIDKARARRKQANSKRNDDMPVTGEAKHDQKRGGPTTAPVIKEGKIGRPSIDLKKLALKLKPRLQMGCSLRDACIQAKVPRTTVGEKMKENEDFYEEVRGYMSYVEILAQQVIYKKIKAGDDYNARWLLERRRRKTYATRTDHTTNDEPINIIFELPPSQFISQEPQEDGTGHVIEVDFDDPSQQED